MIRVSNITCFVPSDAPHAPVSSRNPQYRGICVWSPDQKSSPEISVSRAENDLRPQGTVDNLLLLPWAVPAILVSGAGRPAVVGSHDDPENVRVHQDQETSGKHGERVKCHIQIV